MIRHTFMGYDLATTPGWKICLLVAATIVTTVGGLALSLWLCGALTW